MAIVEDWTFDNGIVDSFEEHVRQSVPGYAMFEDYIVSLSRFFIPCGGKVLDLGASTGELAEAIYNCNKNRISFFGVIDNSNDMFAKLQERFNGNYYFDCCKTDISYGIPISEDFDFIVASLVLQFIPVNTRHIVLEDCFTHLTTNGAMVVVEKIVQETGNDQAMFDTIYQSNKHFNGLSAQQLYDKTQSLVGIMTPLTSAENEEMFKECGFKVTSFFQLGCFKGWILRK
mgnify:CR=1 FL=1